jgi:anti-anti-sigma factor
MKVVHVSGPEKAAMMLTRMIDAKTEQITLIPEGRNRGSTAASLELSHRILPTGEAVARIGGELDVATADLASRYVTQVIDRHPGPVVVDLTALRFCDARGLSALLRMTRYAEQAGQTFRITSTSPTLLRLLRIIGLDRKLLPAN